MSTITAEQEQAIAAKLANMHLPSGLGDEHAACSIAAINLALTGRLTDDIPDCMSEVIGRWIVLIQDDMPDEMRNSLEWKRLLPLAAGTGRKHEKQRLALIIDWMWSTVLPSLQPQADAGGYGPPWRKMCEERTEERAVAATWAAMAAGEAWAAGAAGAARAAMAAMADPRTAMAEGEAWAAGAARAAVAAMADPRTAMAEGEAWAAGAARAAAEVQTKAWMAEAWTAAEVQTEAVAKAWTAAEVQTEAAAEAWTAASTAWTAEAWTAAEVQTKARAEAMAAAEAWTAAAAEAWKQFDPCTLLARLVEVDK